MRRCVEAILITSLLLGVRFDLAVAQETPPVLAFYYAWFDMETWASGQSVDLPNPQYISADAATIERHVSQAQGAGIQAFVQSWYGPQVENNQTEPNFRMLLDIAAAKGFKAAVDFESFSPFYANDEAAINGLSSLLATHVNHPAYLRYQGKPVIFFWRQQRFSAQRWATIRQQVDPNYTTIWIAEGIDLSFQNVFDGHHLYSIAWAKSPAAEYNKWFTRIQNYEAQNGVNRLWVATVMPGYNDTRLGRADGFAVSRRNGDYYRQTWQGALNSQPDMVIINSFNEWPEGTHIEPSVSYGTLYLDITREQVANIGTIIAAQPQDAAGEIAPATAETAEQSAAETIEAAQVTPPDGPYIEASQATNVRRGPDTTFETVDLLPAGSTITVTGRLTDSSWWQIDTDEGAGWVSGSVVTFVGDEAAVPIAEPPAAAEATPTAESASNAAEPLMEITLTSVPTVTPSPTETDEPTPTHTPTATPTPETVIVGEALVTEPVNVRDTPSVDGTRLGGLFPGDSVGVLSRNDDSSWWQIVYDAQTESNGWVAAAFIEFQGASDDVPIFGAEPTPSAPSAESLAGVTLTATRSLISPTTTVAEIPTIAPATTTAEKSTTLLTLESPPTFAPTATSVHQATSAALLTTYSTPEPTAAVDTAVVPELLTSNWQAVPWGVSCGVLLLGFMLYRWRVSRLKRREERRRRAKERLFYSGVDHERR